MSRVITEEFFESLLETLEEHGLTGSAESLRTAPETVSLEGVERYAFDITKGCAFAIAKGAWVQFDDLGRLVAPVQPSAVVSREESEIPLPKDVVAKLKELILYILSKSQKGMNWTELTWMIFHIDRHVYAMTGKPFLDGVKWIKGDEVPELVYGDTPQPVAPVQSGGVDELMTAAKDLLDLMDKTPYKVHLGEESDRVFNYREFNHLRQSLAHLTTTQSAPSVGSVPSILEILDVIFANDGGTIEPEGPVPMRIAKAIHALLTSRMEGK